MRMQVILDSLFARPGSAPIWGGKKGEFRDWTRTRVIRQKVSVKIIVFSMETPCWSPSEGLQHSGRKPVETSGVYSGSLKTFILSDKLESIRLGTSLNILVTQNPKTQGESIFSYMQHVTKKQCGCHALRKNRALFSKPSSLPSWRQANRYTFKNDFYLIKVKTKNCNFCFFSDFTWKPRILWLAYFLWHMA